MLQRYSFFCVFALLLTGLHWWSSHVDVSVSGPVQMETALEPLEKNSEQFELSQSDLRRELLEALDRLVILENYYHSLYGHYTQVPNHAGFSISPRLARHYEIRVAAVAKNQLQVSAFSEEHGRIQDRVWVDQLFRVNANFSLPAPSAEYLKLKAAQQLKLMRDQGLDRAIQEKGIYSGYFRYELRRDSNNHPVAVAIGSKSPVLGIQLESEPRKTLLGESREAQDSFMSENPPGEVGQYAQEWSELAQLAESQIGPTGGGVPNRLPAQEPDDGEEEAPSSSHLVIESITK
jgi:hypothetical protein